MPPASVNINMQRAQDMFGGLRHIPVERRSMVAQYRNKIRSWTLERLPTMPDSQWEQMLDWVKAFGLPLATRQESEPDC